MLATGQRLEVRISVAQMKPYYQSGGITIYHGDCREIIPQLQADVLVTDPPYGVNLGDHKAAAETRTSFLRKQHYESYDDTEENLRSVVVPAIVAALGKVKRGMVFCAGTKIGFFPEPSAIGGVYLPSGCGRTSWGFQNLAHIMLYGTAPGLQNGAMATVLKSTAIADKNGHPCPKPLQWMLWALQLGTLPEETILDPFMGSGTTLRACKDLGRRAIGVELEEKYCEIAVKQLAQEVLFS